MPCQDVTTDGRVNGGSMVAMGRGERLATFLLVGLGLGLVLGIPFVAAGGEGDALTGNESSLFSDGDVELSSNNSTLAAAVVGGDLVTDELAAETTHLTNSSSVEAASSTTTLPVDETANITVDAVDETTNTTTLSVDGATLLSEGSGDGLAFAEAPAAVLPGTISLAVEVGGHPAPHTLSITGTECSHCVVNGSASDGPAVTASGLSPTSTPTHTPSESECTDCGSDTSDGSPASEHLGIVAGLGLVVASRLDVHANLATALAPLTVSSAQPASRVVLGRAAHRIPQMPVAPLYSRSDESDPLEHEDRQELVDLVYDSPGLPISDLSDRLGMPRSTLRYHVRILEEEQELASQHVLGRRRVFPAWMDSPPAVVAAMQDAGSRQVLLTLARTEPATVSGLADELGKAPSTVSYHLDRLESADVVARERDGARILSRLTPTAREPFETDADATRNDVELPERVRITY